MYNLLALSLYNTPEDNESCQSRLHKLTSAIHEKHFTTIGLNQTLNRSIAQRANRFSIYHYDHAITRYIEDTPNEDDPNVDPQLKDIFFIKFEYVFHIDINNQKI